MKDARRAKAEALFQAALDLPEDERSCFLDRECGDDDALLSEVNTLLRHFNEASDSFLSTPIRPDYTEIDPNDAMPERIGHYRLIRRIGEGGMGVVFEARQESPDRSVALKLIRPGWATSHLLRRFQYEAQVLGQLRHPGIATIYEAGTVPARDGPLAAGQPFFAMEYIRGRPLDVYADEKRLEIRQRLELIARVCDAVQHAHFRGVIHRDLKPGNVLVVSEEGDGEAGTPKLGQPKVLDFGVARATDADVQTVTMGTDQGMLVGTVPYMSPEQLSGDAQQIDARCDVYALGVMLYQLLTARLPFDVNGVSLAEAARIIRDEEAVPLGAVDRSLRGEVETIVSRAMSHDCNRRYQTASELAADIRHYLNGEPINAKRDSTIYLLKKSLWRHRGFVAAAGVVFLLVTVFGVVSFVQARRNRDLAFREGQARLAEARQRELAEMRESDALREAAKAEAVNKILQEMLVSATPRISLGREITVREIVDEAARKVDAGTLADQPEVEAAVNATIGRVYHALDLLDAARPRLESALETSRRVYGPEHAEVARLMDDLGLLLRDMSEFEDSRRYIVPALEMRRRLFGDEHLDVAKSLSSYAYLLRGMSDYAQAEVRGREALAIRRKLLGDGHRLVIDSLGGIAEDRWVLGDYDEAESLRRETYELTRANYGNEHPETAEEITALAEVLRAKGKYTEAEPLYRQALDIYRKVYGDRHSTVGVAYHKLGALLFSRRNDDEAENAYRKALAIYAETVGEDHPFTATTLNGLARLAYKKGRQDEAEEMVRRALAIYRRAHGDEHMHVAVTLNNLAFLLNRKGDLDEAEQMFREVLAIYRKTLGDEHPHVAVAVHNMAEIQVRRGDIDSASATLREALSRDRRTLGDEHPSTLTTLMVLGELLLEHNRAEQAEPLLRECLETRTRTLPADDWLIASAQSTLGECLLTLGRHDEAEPLLMSGYESLKDNPRCPSAELQSARDRVAHYYETVGRPPERDLEP